MRERVYSRMLLFHGNFILNFLHLHLPCTGIRTSFCPLFPPKQTTELQTCPLRDSISSLDLPLSFYCHILHRFNLFRYLLSSIRNSQVDPAYTWFEYDDVSRESKRGSLKTRKFAEYRRRTEWVRFSIFSLSHIIKVIFLYLVLSLWNIEILSKLRRRWKNIQWL